MQSVDVESSNVSVFGRTAVLAGLVFAAQLAVHSSLASAQVSVDTILTRHMSASRSQAAGMPRSEADQAIVNGWPLYRTERGQAVFNMAMATLAATEQHGPPLRAFQGCDGLMCGLELPAVDAGGWFAPGRIWTSPHSYVLIVRSPRQRDFRRRSVMNMRYFVMHEFHNSSRNTDVFDTISSHSGAVFVPLYLSKTKQDARGRSFVMLVQVAPIDVVSVHASNMGSEGPGVEIALNSGDTLEPMQGLGAMLAATMAKAFVPRLKVVNHRGEEGRAALRTYSVHAAAGGTRLKVPVTLATEQYLASMTGRLDGLLAPRGGSTPLAVAQRGVVPRMRPTPVHDDPALEIPALAMAAAPMPVARLGRRPDRSGSPAALAPKLIVPPRLAARPSRPWVWAWPWEKSSTPGGAAR